MEPCESNVVPFKTHLEQKTYCIRCRLCRKELLTSDKIKFSHTGNTEPCGNCIFLNEEHLPDWIKEEIENSSWTKGRLKCPRANCTARVGGFDYVQGLLCGCGDFTIPAIWIQDGKVDVRTVDSNVTATANMSYVPSNDEAYPRQMPVVREEYHKSSMNSIAPQNDSFKTSESTDNMSQGTSYQSIRSTCVYVDANVHLLSGDPVNAGVSNVSRSRLIQGSSSQRVLYETESHPSGMADITTGGVFQSDYNHITLPAFKRRKQKLNQSELAYMEENSDQTLQVGKPAEMKLPERSKSESFDYTTNKFNLISVGESKPSHSNSDTVIEEHLICAVCLDYFYNPYRCPCGHVFCESCLRQLYHNRAGNLKCPICRSKVEYIEPANQAREDIDKLKNPAIKQRALFEKSAKHKKWPLPPIGALPFLKRRQTLVPRQDQTLIILASALLFVVCYSILYMLSCIIDPYM